MSVNENIKKLSEYLDVYLTESQTSEERDEMLSCIMSEIFEFLNYEDTKIDILFIDEDSRTKIQIISILSMILYLISGFCFGIIVSMCL